MVRKIIHIEEDLCIGCGVCANTCHESAIAIVNGKARLIRDDYCDGLGDCLPACPTNAISIIEREAAEYDQAAVEERMQAKEQKVKINNTGCVCCKSQLNQWPIQIKLVPANAPYFEHANLLIAADCTAYAYPNFHEEFIHDHTTLIGCPKLDQEDYAKKLTEIIKKNKVKSIKVVRMEVPCCGGFENAINRALENTGKTIPWQVVTITCDGGKLE